jgi:hypothetical protein
MRRLLFCFLASWLSTASALAECKSTLLAETPAAFLTEFTDYMARTGTTAWRQMTDTPRGTMYMTTGSALRLTIKPQDGLIRDIGVFLYEPSDADMSRLNAAAKFIVEHISGDKFADISKELDRHVRYAISQHKMTNFTHGNAFVSVQPLEERTLFVVAGKIACE